MNPIVRHLFASGVLVIASAVSVWAQDPIPPNPANSTFPAQGIFVVGSNGVTVDPLGEFAVTLRTNVNTPIGPPAVVTIDFSACAPDIRLSPQTFPGLSMQGDCVVIAGTNELGVARFRIRGGALNIGNGPGAGFDCVEIRGNGAYLNNVTVAAFDQAGSLNGVTASDLSVWLADFFADPQPSVGRSDFNFNDLINGGDLSIWLSVFFSGGSAQNGGILAGCP